jgi:hypothetical protein
MNGPLPNIVKMPRILLIPSSTCYMKIKDPLLQKSEIQQFNDRWK